MAVPDSRAAVTPTVEVCGRMECRVCRTHKATVREVRGWRGALAQWLGFVPLKCHHCYHLFVVHRLSSRGRQLPVAGSGEPTLGRPAASQPGGTSDGLADERKRAEQGVNPAASTEHRRKAA